MVSGRSKVRSGVQPLEVSTDRELSSRVCALALASELALKSSDKGLAVVLHTGFLRALLLCHECFNVSVTG